MKIPIRINLKKPGCWRDRASNADAWDRWDGEWRRKLGWRAGLQFWSKTNTPGSRVLLSRHWPHHLCWSWSIWVGKVRPHYDGPRLFLFDVCRQYRQIQLRLWWFKASVHWQDSAWMPALGHYKDRAPKMYWKHHLENAEVAGSA